MIGLTGRRKRERGSDFIRWHGCLNVWCVMRRDKCEQQEKHLVQVPAKTCAKHPHPRTWFMHAGEREHVCRCVDCGRVRAVRLPAVILPLLFYVTSFSLQVHRAAFIYSGSLNYSLISLIKKEMVRGNENVQHKIPLKEIRKGGKKEREREGFFIMPHGLVVTHFHCERNK